MIWPRDQLSGQDRIFSYPTDSAARELDVQPVAALVEEAAFHAFVQSWQIGVGRITLAVATIKRHAIGSNYHERISIFLPLAPLQPAASGGGNDGCDGQRQRTPGAAALDAPPRPGHTGQGIQSQS